MFACQSILSITLLLDHNSLVLLFLLQICVQFDNIDGVAVVESKKHGRWQHICAQGLNIGVRVIICNIFTQSHASCDSA